MSYRGIKRVLGETNLERKCRFLFGLCLALLITGAFWWVSTITEKLAKDTARTTGRRLVDSYLLEYHFNAWETRPDWQDLVKLMGEELQSQSYRADFLTLDDRGRDDVLPPADAAEQEILEDLRQRFKMQRAEEAQGADPAAGDFDTITHDLDALKASGQKKNITPVFRERSVTLDDDPDKGEYQYYQPVYWKDSCTLCHRALARALAFPASEEGNIFNEDAMFRVVKVSIPEDEMKRAIAWTHAILITAGIVTVFVSMIALYIIVRYVIVKPLKHLRDVSDEISRGNTNLRADIQTNDEFEDLGMSFNRMLQHLTDTQGELRKVNTDLDAKVDQLAHANMQLYEMNRLKGDFLASVSHELRTPLNSIIGFSEVLHSIDGLDDKQKRYVANIQKSGRVLLDMINDVLDLAKMESGKMEVRPTEFDIRPVITAQCDIVRSLTEEKNIDLSCEIPAQGELPPVYQDQSKVQQILTNLLSNAIKFTPEGGRINVSAQQAGRRGPGDHRDRHRRGDSRRRPGDHLREVPAKLRRSGRRSADPGVFRHGVGAVDREGVVHLARRRGDLYQRIGQGQRVYRPSPLADVRVGCRRCRSASRRREWRVADRAAPGPRPDRGRIGCHRQFRRSRRKGGFLRVRSGLTIWKRGRGH